jgi:hypothetical protein
MHHLDGHQTVPRLRSCAKDQEMMIVHKWP